MSATESATGVTFDNVDASKSVVAMDKSVSFYLSADAKSNTDSTGTKLYFGSVIIRGTNGLEVTPATTIPAIASNSHAVAQNTAVVAKAANTSKEITTSALRFTVTASGKNSIALITPALTARLFGYNNASGATVKIYKDSVSASNVAFSGTLTDPSAGTTSLSLVAANNKNTIDAGSSATFIVTVEGVAGGVANVTPDWNISLSDLGLDTNGLGSVTIQAAAYNNVGQFPITEVK
jgi:hypothetical protein